jgi:hypothetical protein
VVVAVPAAAHRGGRRHLQARRLAYWEPLDGDRLRLDGDFYDLRDCARYITIDLATSIKTSADWTVATAWAITLSGDLVVLDRIRDRCRRSTTPRSSRRCGSAG